MRSELQQANTREKMLLQMLKETEKYGEEARLLEREYDRCAKDEKLHGTAPKTLTVKTNQGNKQINKLDLSVIVYQQEEGLNDSAKQDKEANEAKKQGKDQKPKEKGVQSA